MFVGCCCTGAPDECRRRLINRVDSSDFMLSPRAAVLRLSTSSPGHLPTWQAALKVGYIYWRINLIAIFITQLNRKLLHAMICWSSLRTIFWPNNKHFKLQLLDVGEFFGTEKNQFFDESRFRTVHRYTCALYFFKFQILTYRTSNYSLNFQVKTVKKGRWKTGSAIYQCIL